MTVEEFEEKCMDLIEKIVAKDIKQNRLGAIKVSEKMLERAKEKGSKQAVIDIYERVLQEFRLASDEEYEMLRKQIFGDNNGSR
ncbi:MAG: hypothetical protein IJW36_00215 [Clostridia bacterium]|nr:hypothetical protein [Clostridia bacterium]